MSGCIKLCGPWPAAVLHARLDDGQTIWAATLSHARVAVVSLRLYRLNKYLLHCLIF